MRVNQTFATELDKLLQPDDVVWVHDYHLFPLAKALRDRGHRNKIGFFHHIPFPPPEILTALPNHDRLIPAMCHYDLLGFQTEIDAANFAHYLRNECRIPGRDQYTYQTADRTVRIGIFPVGVETAQLSRLARRAAQAPFVREVMESLVDRVMIIGVDRLDYSKGIALRMEAFDRFLSPTPIGEKGDLSADYTQEPFGNPGICRYGKTDRRNGRPYRRNSACCGAAPSL